MSDYKKCTVARPPGYICHLPDGHPSCCVPVKRETCKEKQPAGFICIRESGHGGPCACEAIASPPKEMHPGMTALKKQVGGSHYKDMAIQPVEFIHANGIGFFEGNAIAYLCRWKVKGGVGDLKKAIHHIELLIELEQKKGGADAIQAHL